MKNLYKRVHNRFRLIKKTDNLSLDPFLFEPRLLLNYKSKLALLWSAKSGCTFSIKWFFNQLNLLDAATYYHPWIHNYRLKVYYHSAEYKRALDEIKSNPDAYTVIKIVRNPFSRAVSSFFGIPKRYFFRDFYPEELKKIEKYLNRKMPSPNGESLSFLDFVHYLEGADVSNVDIHWREQFHPLEKQLLNKITVIKIENAKEELSEFEMSFGLQRTNFDLISGSNHHLKKDDSIRDFWGDRKIKYEHNFKYPHFKNFYNKELERKIAIIYQNDFSSYGYSNKIDYDK